MPSFNIAVISDLHIGYGARSLDLFPYKKSDFSDEEEYDKIMKTLIDDNFIEKFKVLVKKYSIESDYLIIAGDISHTAQPAEFILASQIITEIQECLKVEESNIIFVPGNHEVDWIELGIHDTTDFRWQQRYSPFKYDASIFNNYLSKWEPNILSEPYFYFKEYNDIYVIGYNSSFHDNPEISIHYGIFNPDVISEFEEKIGSINNNKVKIFLIHHHPIQYTDVIPSSKDFSIMHNAESLMNFLEKYQFDLLIHGHKHAPHYPNFYNNSGFPLVFGSGSFSARLSIKWAGTINNQFHNIEIHGREKNTNCIYGVIKSWAYTCAKGWEPSNEKYNGISPKYPFGKYIHTNVLKTELKKQISHEYMYLKSKLPDDEKIYISLTKLLSKIDNHKYIPFKILNNSLHSLSKEMSFNIHEDEDPDEFFIILEAQNAAT